MKFLNKIKFDVEHSKSEILIWLIFFLLNSIHLLLNIFYFRYDFFTIILHSLLNIFFIILIYLKILKPIVNYLILKYWI